MVERLDDDRIAGREASLAAPERLRALERTGLGAEPDEGMERFARLAARLLGVPVALVLLLEEHRRVLPGMVGLDEPWASSRQGPLPPSLRRHGVVPTAMILCDDVRSAPSDRAAAVEGLGAVACAGMPLTDDRGNVLGVLAAIDTAPRAWSDQDVRALRDLAPACSGELRLRILTHTARKVRGRAQRAFERSQLLLRAADELGDTTGLAQVRRTVKELVTSDLKPAYVELVLVEGERMRRVIDTEDPSSLDVVYEEYELGSDWPTALAVRTDTLVEVPDTDALEHYAPEVRAAFSLLGLSSAVFVPLPGTRTPLGALVLGWDSTHEIDVVERAVLRSLAGYTARAVERAVFVDRRVQTAQALQQAMLTDLPRIPGLEIAALYRPAAQEDMVGGDWYDAYPLPDDGGRGAVAFTVGDITGHDIHAAVLMGQVRSMLRQADMDHSGHGPARAVTAFERANRELGVGASGTMLHAHLRRQARGWLLTWTNVGHMTPVVASAAGDTEQLREHDLLFHPELPDRPRTDHQRLLETGSTLLLFTDGLVEQRDHDLDTVVARAARLLAAGAREPLPDLLGAITDEVAGDAHDDDVVLLAVRLTGGRAA
ncbi:protein serine phosphatase [Glycomyces fuscus]|nr:protein serine phosphatase [Glycomyces fuscus]